MKHLFLFTLLIPLSLFSGFTTPKEFIIPEPDLSVHKVMDKTIEVLVEKYPLNPIGFGMNGKFEYLSISFQVHRPVSKEEARKMLYECVTIFLEKINTNESIRPHLKNYPFTFENVGIVFYISDENNNDLFHPEISVAKWSSYGVSYKTSDKENSFDYKETYEETHEEALALLQKGDSPPQEINLTREKK